MKTALFELLSDATQSTIKKHKSHFKFINGLKFFEKYVVITMRAHFLLNSIWSGANTLPILVIPVDHI